jgi:hypothetical protein
MRRKSQTTLAIPWYARNQGSLSAQYNAAWNSYLVYSAISPFHDKYALANRSGPGAHRPSPQSYYKVILAREHG